MSRNHCIFVTGTDTEVGKTYVSTGLLRGLNAFHYATIGLKPISAGCDRYGHNDDALQLQKAASIKLPYDEVNPFAYARPTSPNIAAQLDNQYLNARSIYQHLIGHEADVIIIEGAGGWHVPINDNETLADTIKPLDPAIILVVGLRLGCLNHAILTQESILRNGLNILGWVGNTLDAKMPYLEEYIQSLHDFMGSPCLGILDRESSPELTMDFQRIKSSVDFVSKGLKERSQ